MSEGSTTNRRKSVRVTKYAIEDANAALLALSTQNIENDDFEEEQIEELKEAFALFDQSGDGKISVKEMQLIMRASGSISS